jgi:hypothetical protein
MGLSSFTHDILLLFAGPIVWGLHFLAIYGFTGVVCARALPDARWLGIGWSGWVVVAMGVLALAVLAGWLRMRPISPAPDDRRFLRWTAVALAGLATLAIVWETLAVFLVPGCAPGVQG